MPIFSRTISYCVRIFNQRELLDFSAHDVVIATFVLMIFTPLMDGRVEATYRGKFD